MVIFPPHHYSHNYTHTPQAQISYTAWGCWYRRQKGVRLAFNSICESFTGFSGIKDIKHLAEKHRAITCIIWLFYLFFCHSKIFFFYFFFKEQLWWSWNNNKNTASVSGTRAINEETAVEYPRLGSTCSSITAVQRSQKEPKQRITEEWRTVAP